MEQSSGYAVAAFWAFALVAIIPGIFILLSREIVRAAFWLLVAFTGFAGLYLLLGADFLAFVQVMVYIGGVLILILFGVMLTKKDPVIIQKERGVGLVVPIFLAALLLLGGLFYAIFRTGWGSAPVDAPQATAAGIGDLLLTDFLLPFEISSVLLLAALVGAAYIIRFKRGEE